MSLNFRRCGEAFSYRIRELFYGLECSGVGRGSFDSASSFELAPLRMTDPLWMMEGKERR